MTELMATPGPWVAATHHRGAVYSGEVCVAQTSHAGRSIGEMVANAHLIAAAPDLYEAAGLAHDLLERVGDSRKDREIIDALADALAKARGVRP